ncbi:MAG: sensor domain-containing diguanylate cyclase [Kosmotogaceae bacterium]|nr:sensor domain-containing diguanylate cyclase [Kosmotogaceae bacterium]
MVGGTEEKELAKLKAITRIHHSVGSSLELEEISRILVRELIDIVYCDACALVLIEGNKVRILAERGFSKTFGEIEFSTYMPAVKYIVDTKRAIFTGDVLNSPAAGCVSHGCAMCSLICVPVMVNDEAKGIIHLDSSRKNAFDEDDLEFVDLLAKEISIDIERSFLYAQVRDIAIRDGLTGCFNRRKFDVDIMAEIANAKCSEEPLSFLMLDIDWFKKYNDFHGHSKGDVLLKEIVNILTSNVRASDKAYRYGGEEFAILLPNTDRKIALLTAKRLCKTIEQEQFEGEKES